MTTRKRLTPLGYWLDDKRKQMVITRDAFCFYLNVTAPTLRKLLTSRTGIRPGTIRKVFERFGLTPETGMRQVELHNRKRKANGR